MTQAAFPHNATQRTRRKTLAYFTDATDAGDARKVRNGTQLTQRAKVEDGSAASILALRSLRALRWMGTGLYCQLTASGAVNQTQ